MIRELIVALYIISTLFLLMINTFSGVFIPVETANSINSNPRIAANFSVIEGNLTSTYTSTQANLGSLSTNSQCTDPTCGNNYYLLLWNAMKAVVDMSINFLTAPFRLLDIVYELLIMIFPSLTGLIGFVIGVVKTAVFFVIAWEVFGKIILGRLFA